MKGKPQKVRTDRNSQHLTTVHLREKQFISGCGDGVKRTMHTEVMQTGKEYAKFMKDGKW